MIKVHHLNNSRSQRVLWLLEELGLPYEVVHYQRDRKTMLAPPELRAVHPLGKSPLLEEEGKVVAESAVIIEHLLERHDHSHRLHPAPPQPSAIPSAGPEDERERFRYWLHYAEGSAMPPLLLSLVFSRLRSAPMPFFARPIARGIADKAMAGFVGPQLKLHLDYLEAELGRHEWFAGPRFTAADIQMSFPVEAAVSRAGAASRPRLKAFVERIHARPAYQRALVSGGPFETAPG